MRFLVAALIALGIVGCGGSDDAAVSSAERVERCVEGLIQGIPRDAGTSEEELRFFAETAYCRQFEDAGLVYDDGALEIGAQEWLDRSGSEECAQAGSGGSATTVPCEEPEGRRRIDCALLRHVRKREAQEYVEDLQARGEVECDDGTPIADVGVP